MVLTAMLVVLVVLAVLVVLVLLLLLLLMVVVLVLLLFNSKPLSTDVNLSFFPFETKQQDRVF